MTTVLLKIESQFYPRLSNVEQKDITQIASTRDKFRAANAGLQRKLERMAEDAQDAFDRVIAIRTSTTAHSDLADTLKQFKQKADGAMDYFSISIDTLKLTAGVLTRARAGAEAGGDNLQVENCHVNLEKDSLKAR